MALRVAHPKLSRQSRRLDRSRFLGLLSLWYRHLRLQRSTTKATRSERRISLTKGHVVQEPMDSLDSHRVAADCVLSGSIFLYAAHSEPYEFSERWLRSSPEVREKVGEVKRTRLSVSGVFSDEFKGDVRDARVSTYAEGSKGSLVANLQLQKRGVNDWVVIHCRLAPQ